MMIMTMMKMRRYGACIGIPEFSRIVGPILKIVDKSFTTVIITAVFGSVGGSD